MKYKLTRQTKDCYGHTLHRIECVESFSNVKEGDLGGWIESEDNLSYLGNAWVYGDAKVYGNAKVCDNAKVCGNAWVCDNAWVCGDAKVYGNAWVYGDAKVYGNAKVCGDAWVYGDAKVCDNAKVCGNAKVYSNAKVCGDAEVYGYAWICGDAEVCGDGDYIVLKNSWSSCRYFTYTASNNKWRVGCFYGTGEELIAKAYEDSELSGKCYEASVRYIEEIELIKSDVGKIKK